MKLMSRRTIRVRRASVKPRKAKAPKGLTSIRRDPRVESVDDADCADYWVHLNPGWSDPCFNGPEEPAHTIHEWSIKDVLRRLKDVKPCRCEHCRDHVCQVARESGELSRYVCTFL